MKNFIFKKLKGLVLGLGIVLGSNASATENNHGIKPENASQKMRGWISENIYYPTSAAENKEEGTVYVAFTISENGLLESCEIAQGVSANLDATALATVQKMPVDQLISGSEAYNGTFIVPIKFVIK
ncbi:MAG: energy transducer TonB [Crocinitomicaceae bacterium]|jgi:TonB family protein|nr:energy transducer TonB [Crocinitomicaceae bacterium]